MGRFYIFDFSQCKQQAGLVAFWNLNLFFVLRLEFVLDFVIFCCFLMVFQAGVVSSIILLSHLAFSAAKYNVNSVPLHDARLPCTSDVLLFLYKSEEGLLSRSFL